MTDFFEPTENKEQWQRLYKEISQIMFKGGKARHIIEHLYKAQKFLQPDVSGNFAHPKKNKKESEVAVAFAEWITKNGWERKEHISKQHWFKEYQSPLIAEQLYKKFLSAKATDR